MVKKSILQRASELVFASDDDDMYLPISALKALKRRTKRPLKKLTERELISLESQIGAAIFGDKPGHVKRREFFNLDERTWIWYEESVDADGTVQELTTRYELQEQGILKVQPNYQYSYLEGEELENFVLAVSEYYERVARQVYHKDPSTGQPLEETEA